MLTITPTGGATADMNISPFEGYMNPAQQTTDWLIQVNNFFSNLREAGPLIGIIMLLIIIAVVFGFSRFLDYRLQKAFAARDLARAAADTETEKSTDLMMNKLVDMVGAFRQTVADGTQTQQQGQIALVAALNRIADLQSANTTVLSEHDVWARGSVKEILTAITRVEAKVDDALKSIGEIKAFFPEGDNPLAKVERELAEAIELLKDCKKSTDENKVVLLPEPIHDAEDASALTPGSEAA